MLLGFDELAVVGGHVGGKKGLIRGEAVGVLLRHLLGVGGAGCGGGVSLGSGFDVLRRQGGERDSGHGRGEHQAG
jgi:hypothetical protein